MGFAFTSIFDVEIPGSSDFETDGAPLEGVSFLVAGILAVTSLELVRWGIFRISLYRG